MVVCLPMSLALSSHEAAACCTAPNQVRLPASTGGQQPAGCSKPAVALGHAAFLVTATAAGAADGSPPTAAAAVPQGTSPPMPRPGTPGTPTSAPGEACAPREQPADAQASPQSCTAEHAAAAEGISNMLPCEATAEEVPMMDASIFFACAPLCVTVEELREVFGACGELADIQLYRSFPKCRVSKGCGIITFATQEGADAALERLNGTMPFARARKPLTVRRASAPVPASTKPAAATATHPATSSSSSSTAIGAGARCSPTTPGAARVRQASASSPGALQSMQWAALQANPGLSSVTGAHSPPSSSIHAGSSGSGYACMVPGSAHMAGGWSNSEPLPPGLQVGSPAAAVVPTGFLPVMGSPAAASLLLSGVAGASPPGSAYLSSSSGLTWVSSTQSVNASPSRLSMSGSPAAAQAAGRWPPQGPGGVLMSPDAVAIAMNHHLQQQQQAQAQVAAAAAAQQHSGALLSPQVMASNGTMAVGSSLAPLQEEPHHLQQQQQSVPVLTMAGMRQLHRWESAPSQVGRARPPRPGVRPSWPSPAAGAMGQQGDSPYAEFSVEGPAAGMVGRVQSAPAGLLLTPQMRAQLLQQPWLLGQLAPPSSGTGTHQQLLAHLAAQASHGQPSVPSHSFGSDSGFSSSCGTPHAQSTSSGLVSSSSWLALLDAHSGCGEALGQPGGAPGSSPYALTPLQQVQHATSMAQQLQLSGVSGLGPQALPGDCQMHAPPCCYGGAPLGLTGLESDMAMLLAQPQQQEQQDSYAAVALPCLFGTG